MFIVANNLEILCYKKWVLSIHLYTNNWFTVVIETPYGHSLDCSLFYICWCCVNIWTLFYSNSVVCHFLYLFFPQGTNGLHTLMIKHLMALQRIVMFVFLFTLMCFLFTYTLFVSFYYFYFSVRLLSVLLGHSVFSSRPQRPMISDFEGFSIPDFIHYIYFPILILEKEPVFSLLNVQC